MMALAISNGTVFNFITINGFRDSVPVCKLHPCCQDRQKFQAKQAVLLVVFKAKQDLKLIKRFESKFYQQFYIHHRKTFFFQHYYQSCCDYFSKMGCMAEGKAVFEQLTSSNFKKQSSTALRTFNNSTMIITNNSDKVRISWVVFLFLWLIFELIQQAFLVNFMLFLNIFKIWKTPF